VDGLLEKSAFIGLLRAGFGGEGLVCTVSGGGEGFVSLGGLDEVQAEAQMWSPSRSRGTGRLQVEHLTVGSICDMRGSLVG